MHLPVSVVTALGTWYVVLGTPLQSITHFPLVFAVTRLSGV